MRVHACMHTYMMCPAVDTRGDRVCSAEAVIQPPGVVGVLLVAGLEAAYAVEHPEDE